MFDGKRIEFNEKWKDLGNILNCPYCECHRLHLGKIKIFDRKEMLKSHKLRPLIKDKLR